MGVIVRSTLYTGIILYTLWGIVPPLCTYGGTIHHDASVAMWLEIVATCHKGGIHGWVRAHYN